MNNTVILKALQSQLETIKTEAIDHETLIFEPAVTKLVEKVKAYFEERVFQNIHNIELTSENIFIFPSDTSGYGNDITINYRSSWREEEGRFGYFQISSYRPDLDSREYNTIATKYHVCMAAIAMNFESICEQWKTKWMPAFNKLSKAKSEKYDGIYTLEREIRRVENEIAESEKQVYNEAGFECTLKDYTSYDSNYDNGKNTYTKKVTDHMIRAYYGRGRWDFVSIHSFKVMSFPKAKHSKVIITYKVNSADDVVRTLELNKQRYADFVSQVYDWQTKGAAQREADIDDKVARWNA